MEDLVDKLKESCDIVKETNDFEETARRNVDINLDNCLNRIGLISHSIRSEFLIYLSRQIDFHNETPELIELASMGANYNLSFVLQYFHSHKPKFRMPYGSNFKVQTFFNDDIELNTIFIETNSFKDHQTNRHTLLPFEVMRISDMMAEMQRNSMTLKNNTVNHIIENNTYVLNFLNEQFLNYRPLYFEVIENGLAPFFLNSRKLILQMDIFIKSITTFQQLHPKQFDTLLPHVLSHGFLISELVRFSGNCYIDQIGDWHNVTYLPVGYDIISLMVNSLDTKTRRDNYKIILSYYHSKFQNDNRHKFDLSLLENYYKKAIKFVVFRNLHRILTVIASDKVSLQEKKVLAQRWEAAVDDAYNYEFGNVNLE